MIRSSFDTLGSVAVKAKAVFPSIYWSKYLPQLSIPLIISFNTSVSCFFFLNLMKQWVSCGVFSPWSSVGNEFFPQWRFRSHLEIQSVSSILCFSGRQMEYLISLFGIGLFISYNEGKFVNIVYGIQKNDTFHDCSHTLFIFYIFLITQQLFISVLRGEILLLSYCNSSELLKAIQSLKAIAFT